MSGEFTGGGGEMPGPTAEVPMMAEPAGASETAGLGVLAGGGEVAVLAEPAATTGASETAVIAEPGSTAQGPGESAIVEPPSGASEEAASLVSEPNAATEHAGQESKPDEPLLRESGPDGPGPAEPPGLEPDAAEKDVQPASKEERAETWQKHWSERGEEIETQLAKTEYKEWFHCGKEHGGTQEHIDFYKDGVGVSLKTVAEPNAASMRDMQNEINALQRSGIEHSSDDGATWDKTELVLDVRVPEGKEAGLDGLDAYGAQRGIVVHVRPY
jgi:hypothetical protein